MNNLILKRFFSQRGVKKALLSIVIIIPILILVLVLTHRPVSIQDKTALDSLEKSLFSLRKQYMDSAFNFNNYSFSLGYKFSQKLTEALQIPETFDYGFDSLKKKILIVESLDDSIKIYSWFNPAGGTWHSVNSIVQFKTKNGIKVKKLNTGLEFEKGECTDASYVKIQILSTNISKIYIIIGTGTHGSGSHFKIIRGFKIENMDLVEFPHLFAGKKHLVASAARGKDIDLFYNEKTKQITYTQEKVGEIYDDGRISMNIKKIVLSWDGEKFRPQKIIR